MSRSRGEDIFSCVFFRAKEFDFQPALGLVSSRRSRRRRSVEVAAEDGQELLGLERLAQEIGGARRQEITDGRRVRVPAENDDRNRGGGRGGGEIAQDLLAGGVRKAVVEQDEAGPAVDRPPDARVAGLP